MKKKMAEPMTKGQILIFRLFMASAWLGEFSHCPVARFRRWLRPKPPSRLQLSF
jgi:hypothetical protein